MNQIQLRSEKPHSKHAFFSIDNGKSNNERGILGEQGNGGREEKKKNRRREEGEGLEYGGKDLRRYLL